MTATKFSVISFLIGFTVQTVPANPALALAQQSPPAASSPENKNPNPQGNLKQSLPNPDSFGIYHAGDGVTPPKLIFSVEPEFSETARKKKIRGDCVISFIVATNGTATDIHVAKSIADTVPTKQREAALELDQNAVKVVAVSIHSRNLPRHRCSVSDDSRGELPDLLVPSREPELHP